MLLVNIPITPIPTSIDTAATTPPASVRGAKFPELTVVTVTIAQHSASP
ncbi:hypothetical protein OO015_13315 [Thermomicrobium sp. 4228-Ro]|nr:hypothetical protein [Thermomicrobium sp. 4228-Ro]MCX2728463.1 hypothetical protein [Thermomicrobium sp. 4228-Ro]